MCIYIIFCSKEILISFEWLFVSAVKNNKILFLFLKKLLKTLNGELGTLKTDK